MTFKLLKEDIETYILFGTSPIYFVVIGVIQAKHLKYLKIVKNKYVKPEFKRDLVLRIKRLKKLTPLYMLVGLVVHLIVYAVCAGSVFRYGYFVSIGVFYFIFLAVMYINFLLKGSSILKDTGDFGGLPG